MNPRHQSGLTKLTAAYFCHSLCDGVTERSNVALASLWSYEPMEVQYVLSSFHAQASTPPAEQGLALRGFSKEK